MSFEPSSPSTDITNTDPFECVAYSDIIEGSIYYEKEMEISPTIKCPVPLDAFQQRYIGAFNRYPSQEDFRFQINKINEQRIADGSFPRPSSPILREPSPTLRPPATPPSLASKPNCPKTPSKKDKIKLQSPIISKENDLNQHLQAKIRSIQNMRSQNLSPLQAGQLASQLAQDLLQLATFQARLQEEYKYMLELSLSASGLK